MPASKDNFEDGILEIKFIQYCRNGSGDGQGFYRVLMMMRISSSIRMIMAIRFMQNTPEETKAADDLYGKFFAFVDMEDDRRNYKMDSYFEEIDDAIFAYERERDAQTARDRVEMKREEQLETALRELFDMVKNGKYVLPSQYHTLAKVAEILGE